MVPFQLKALLTQGHTRLNDRISRIKNILLGGAPVSKELRHLLHDFPNNIFETFGMTETVSHIAMRKLSQGETSINFETTDGAIILAQDDRDCLVVIAPELSPTPVISNDIVELLDERHFRWLGRVDNVINTGGIKILAEDMEHRLSQIIHHRFFVAGKPDKELGQKLILLIESVAYSSLDEAELTTHMKETLGRFEVPKEIIYTTHFNETGTHKIDRKATLIATGVITEAPLS